MLSFFEEKIIAYDGSQLRPLFAFESFKVEGDSIVSWIGPCHVANEHMVDGEDLFAGESIASSQMLHFIVELFGKNLFSMVAVQRLLSSMMKDLLSGLSNESISREGDDLYWKGGKLSISIASTSAVSSMIHFAINISNQGTPVKTASLEDLGLDASNVSKQFMESVLQEINDIERATKKVFPL